VAFAAFVALLAIVGVTRGIEVLVSARRARRSSRAVVAEGGWFPVMVVLHLAVLVLPPLEVLALGRTFRPVLAALAAVVLLLATALRVWTLRTLGAAWNVRVLLPEPRAVVTTGPYAFLRHPNYLAVLVEIAALPLLHAAWLSALALTALNALVLAHRIRVEEAVLSRLPAWSAAMRDRARLIPGVF
jgi:methyltransferase